MPVSVGELNGKDPITEALKQVIPKGSALYIVQNFHALSQATKIEASYSRGKVSKWVYSKQLADNFTRLKALIELAKLANHYPKQQIGVTHDLTPATMRAVMAIDGKTRGRLPAELADEEGEENAE